MKYVVKVANQRYEVEIEDIHTRPIIACVDGQKFEVSPADDNNPSDTKAAPVISTVELTKTSTTPATAVNPEALTAPLPGTVIEIFVRAGDSIEAGQTILVIEAMKMKNSIRSTRAGTIAEVLVSAGQTVAHKQTLVRFG